MPGVVRVGDNCSGHGDWPPRPGVSGSPDVFANGIPVERNGDPLAVHCNPVPQCHGASFVGGRNVYANGKSIQAQGDPISCGSVCSGCSSNVFIN